MDLPVSLDRPPLYRMPDPAAWQAKHGGTAYPLDVAAPLGAEDMADLLKADRSTILAREANDIHDAIAQRCEAAGAIAGVPDSTDVFFNPEDGRFWAFPVGDLNVKR